MEFLVQEAQSFVPAVLLHNTPFTSVFDDLANAALDAWKVPGISIAVVDGESTFSKGYGFATLPDTPVTPETIFYCASTTKAFTGAAASLLVDDNEVHPQVQWTTPISKLIPEDFVLQDDYWTQHITIQDALSHRSGLPGHLLAYDGKNSTPKDLTRALRHLPLSREPRTELQYCNLMYVVICHVIETVTGSWLGDFFKSRIWDPLGMTSTYFHINDVLESGNPVAKGYNWNPVKNDFDTVDWSPISGDGAGGIFSNVLDYAKWIRSMIHQNGPLSQAGHKAVTTPHMISDTDLPGYSKLLYGYGWNIASYHGEPILSHTGGLQGFNAEVIFLPDRKWGVVLLTNTNPTGIYTIQKLKYHLIDELLQVPQKDREDWNARNRKSVAEREHSNKHAKELLFPNAGHLPLALPISKYTGTFSHPGYLTLTVSLKNDSLYINATDRTWPFVIEFEHVSGEYFLVNYFLEGDNNSRAATKIKFEIGEDGTVNRMGGLFEESLAPELIWFERVNV